MAATVARLQAVLSAETRDFDRGMAKSESKMKSVGKVAGLAGAAVVGGLAVGLAKSVGAAKDAQVAQIGLEAALKSANISYQAHGKEIDAAIQKTSKLAALDDEDLSNAFAKLVRTTGDVTKATEGMNLAADIARARHISLEAATKLVERASLGTATAFKRVGLEVTPVTENVDRLKAQIKALKQGLDGATESQEASIKAQIAEVAAGFELAKAQDKRLTATRAIDEAQKHFAGSAEQYGKSSAAASERFGVALENLQERIGTALLPTLTKLTLWGVQFLEWSERNWPRFQQIIRNAFDAVKPTIQAVIDIATVLKDTIEKHWDTIERNFEALKTVVQNTLKIIGDAIKLVSALLHGDWSEAWRLAKEIVVTQIDTIKTVIGNQLENYKAAAFALGRAIFNGLKDGVTGIGQFFLDTLNGIKEQLSNLVGWVKDNWVKLLVAAIAGVPLLIGKAFAEAWPDALELIQKPFLALKDWVKEHVVDPIVEFFEDIPGRIGDAVSKIKGPSGLDLIKKLAPGGTGPFGAGDIIPPGDIGPTGGGNFPSLSSNLQDEAALARSMFAYQIQDYNPASRLPSGAPSDHAVFPAKAFDAMFSPPTGWGNIGARAFFAAMIGRPGIHYAILGDKIWSAERGLHGYGYGGHENHVHVSGYDRGGWLQPGWTMAYNGTGRPEPVGFGGGVNVYLTNSGVIGSETEVVRWLRNAFAKYDRQNGRPAFGGGF